MPFNKYYISISNCDESHISFIPKYIWTLSLEMYLGWSNLNKIHVYYPKDRAYTLAQKNFESYKILTVWKECEYHEIKKPHFSFEMINNMKFYIYQSLSKNKYGQSPFF